MKKRFAIFVSSLMVLFSSAGFAQEFKHTRTTALQAIEHAGQDSDTCFLETDPSDLRSPRLACNDRSGLVNVDFSVFYASDPNLSTRVSYWLMIADVSSKLRSAGLVLVSSMSQLSATLPGRVGQSHLSEYVYVFQRPLSPNRR